MSAAAEAFTFIRERKYQAEAYETIAPSTAPYLIKGALPARGNGFMVGASKAGKTFVAIDWALKLATGATVMGRKAQHVGVVYIGAEDSDGCRSRIAAWRRKNPRQSFTPFKFIGSGVNLMDDDDVDALIVDLQDISDEFAEEGHRLGLVVFDTLARCTPGADENSSEMGRAVDALERVGRALDAFTLTLAHHGKSGAAGGIRGWSGLDAASDATITVERDEQFPDQRRLSLTKVKNGPDGAVVAFALERQNLGMTDEDGEELWSCVVSYTDVATLATKVRRVTLSPYAEIVLRVVGRLSDNVAARQAPPVDVEGIRPGTWAVRRADVSLEASSEGLKFDGDKDTAYRQRFGRALADLVKAKRIRMKGDAIWLL